MKAEFKLSITHKGKPCIKLIYHDRSEEIEQLLLRYFIDMADKKGIELIQTNGQTEVGTNNSWAGYEIRIKE